MSTYFLVDLITRYGYDLVFIGSILEGDTVVLIGGALSRNASLFLPYVILVAFLGTLISDQFLFWLGKKHGTSLIAKYERLQRVSDKLKNWIGPYEALIILCFRFMYGIRFFSPIILGSLGISHFKFFILNFISAAIWAGLMASIGYTFANAVDSLVSQHGILHIIILLIITSFVLILFAHMIWQKNRANKME